MGQQNQPVEFQEVGQSDLRKARGRGIFGGNYQVNKKAIKEVCQLPDCHCPAEHQTRKDIKVCSVCNNQAKNFRKHQKISYQTADHTRRRPMPAGFSMSNYRPGEPVQQEPPVYYFNAWSLPLQKCYATRTYKTLTDTKVTEVEEEPQPSFQIQPTPYQRPYQPYIPPQSPKREQMEYVDYSEVDPRHRYQNLFMYDQ